MTASPPPPPSPLAVQRAWVTWLDQVSDLATARDTAITYGWDKRSNVVKASSQERTQHTRWLMYDEFRQNMAAGASVHEAAAWQATLASIGPTAGAGGYDEVSNAVWSAFAARKSGTAPTDYSPALDLGYLASGPVSALCWAAGLGPEEASDRLAPVAAQMGRALPTVTIASIEKRAPVLLHLWTTMADLRGIPVPLPLLCAMPGDPDAPVLPAEVGTAWLTTHPDKPADHRYLHR